MGLVIAWKECEVMFKHILNQKSWLNIQGFQVVQDKRVVSPLSQTDRFALYLGIRVDFTLE
ncbi:uncharacterized protein G2W53_007648 [Senna tora]|uniref:Uncharacterized protein n=1 Tax=Senna tora TaxID=362788 RepID=A0A834X6J1_9FABA|nr:uncharacterized protein G2W53_007648 [Senna tora]